MAEKNGYAYRSTAARKNRQRFKAIELYITLSSVSFNDNIGQYF